MGLPAPLLSALSELEQEAAEIGPSTEGGSQAPIEAALEQAKKIEGALAQIGPTLAEMFVEIERSARAVGSAGSVYLDQAIEQLAVRESELAARFLPMIEEARKLRAQTFRARHLTREEKARHALVLDRQAKALGAALSVLRDERWRLLALRAEIEPAGDAPVFDDSDQLLEYLQANRK